MSVFKKKKKNLFFRPKEDIPWGMFKYSKTKGISRKGLKKKRRPKKYCKDKN